MRSWLLLLPALPVLAADPTWREVQPILEQCHQKGEIAPMAFTSYADARPFAKAIRQAVAVTQTMPPWHAAKGSHPFRNDRSLSFAEINTLTAWADSGARDGTPAQPSAAAAGPSQWKLGRPDRTVKVPGFAVPASGQLNYSFLIVPLDLKEDTWIRAAEFRIDQRGAVHHINAFVRPPGSSYLAEFPKNKIFSPTVVQRAKRHASERVFDRRQLVLGYEPGYEPMPWLADGAKLIPAGSDLVLGVCRK